MFQKGLGNLGAVAGLAARRKTYGYKRGRIFGTVVSSLCNISSASLNPLFVYIPTLFRNTRVVFAPKLSRDSRTITRLTNHHS